MAAVTLGACSGGPSGGDREACDAFREATEAVQAAMDDVTADPTAYAELRHGLPQQIRDAAALADDPELAADMNQAARLWGSDDVAYYLAQQQIYDACG